MRKKDALLLLVLMLQCHEGGGDTRMWDLHTEPVSKKEKLQLTTEPKEWQVEEWGRSAWSVCGQGGDEMNGCDNKNKVLM